MALSARDWRVLKAIEEDLATQDSVWVARFERLAGGRRPHLLRRRWKAAVALLCWVGLVCADATARQGILLWIAIAAGVAGVVLFVWRRHADKPAATGQNAPRKYLNS
jgi:Protein of unknown function (DUF3040)